MKLPKWQKLSGTFLLIVSLVTITSSTFKGSTNYVQAETIASTSLTDQLDAVQKKLADVKLKKQNLQASINSESAKRSQYGVEIANLTYEIDLKETEIEELQLEIDSLNLQIEILQYNIEDATNKIQETEDNISDLEEKTSDMLTKMYLSQKTYSDVDWIFDPNSGSDFIKNDLYQKSIQEDTNSDIQTLNDERKELEDTKTQLNEDKIEIEKNKTLIDEQKIAIEKDKTNLDQQRAILNQKLKDSLSSQQQYQFALENSSDEEKKLLADEEYLKQQIFNQIGSIPNGSYVKAGTIIGREGNTGWSTGPHLHFGTAYNGVTQDPCNFVNCSALTSGALQWPISPHGTITSWYGTRTNDYHAAIDISTGTGKGAILAAHDGWITYGKQYCYDLTWVKCNGGYANYAIICEDKNNCNNGYKTLYWHLAN